MNRIEHLLTIGMEERTSPVTQAAARLIADCEIGPHCNICRVLQGLLAEIGGRDGASGIPVAGSDLVRAANCSASDAAHVEHDCQHDPVSGQGAGDHHKSAASYVGEGVRPDTSGNRQPPIVAALQQAQAPAQPDYGEWCSACVATPEGN